MLPILLAHALRDAGVRAEFALGGQTVSKQQDIAKSRNARLLVTVDGADLQVKDLQTKSQQTVAVATAVTEISKLLGR